MAINRAVKENGMDFARMRMIDPAALTREPVWRVAHQEPPPSPAATAPAAPTTPKASPSTEVASKARTTNVAKDPPPAPPLERGGAAKSQTLSTAAASREDDIEKTREIAKAVFGAPDGADNASA